jgi:hypothetical protein
MDYLYILYCVQILIIVLYNVSVKLYNNKKFFYLNGRDASINNSELLTLPLDDIDEWGQYVNIELI